MSSSPKPSGQGDDQPESLERPNILWVIADQWRGQATGYAGDPNAVTPNLDKLAAEGLRFDLAFSSHPLCVPFRGALLTGQRGIHSGVTGHTSSLPRSARTVAHVLREHGYRTAWFGKWHLADHVPPSGLPRGENWRWVATRSIPPEQRGGFEHWEAFEAGNVMHDPWIHTHEDPVPRRRTGYQPDVLVEACANFAEASRDDPKPWFAVCSVEPPHNPYDTAPPEYASRYDPATIVLRPNVPLAEPVNTEAREQAAGYYANIEAVDASIGRLLERVDGATTRPTAVFFMSDHGDMLGSHGLYRKTQPFEEAIRIPLLVRWPGATASGSVSQAMVCELDIVPTMLELLGFAPPGDMDGISLASVFSNPAELGPSQILLQHIDGLAHSDTEIVPWRAIRTRDALYGTTPNEECWVFDLTNDPYEVLNHARLGSGAELRARLRPLLVKALNDALDPFCVPPSPRPWPLQR